MIAGAVVLPDPAPARLATPTAEVSPPRPARPPAPEPATETGLRTAYPPAPTSAPDFASAILSAIPKAPEPRVAPQPAAQVAPPEPRPEPAQRVALLTPPQLATPHSPREDPAWRRFAAPAPPSRGRPQIAIVIDDVGLNHRLAARTVALPAPLTLALLPYARDLPELARRARAAGHELLVHLPMEPENGSANDPGPKALLMSLGEREIDGRIAWNLQRFDGFVGVNNHMGSRFTASPQRMTRLMLQLKARGLLFLDSKTSEASVGYRLARRHDVPAAERDVFLDNDRDPAAIRARLAEVERIARRRGRGIAIGHPYPETLDALAGWLAAADRNGLVLAPVSALVARELSG